jgi:hypothetical protein
MVPPYNCLHPKVRTYNKQRKTYFCDVHMQRGIRLVKRANFYYPRQ